ncbi:MAG: hypothetical protein ABEK17_01825 [Candidatus Aenigmatarchaeota archaeon]
MLQAIDLFGSIGLAALLIAFFMNEIDRWDDDVFEYNFLNTLGASVLLIYAWWMNSEIFIVLESIWIIISIKGIIENFK